MVFRWNHGGHAGRTSTKDFIIYYLLWQGSVWKLDSIVVAKKRKDQSQSQLVFATLEKAHGKEKIPLIHRAL